MITGRGNVFTGAKQRGERRERNSLFFKTSPPFQCSISFLLSRSFAIFSSAAAESSKRPRPARESSISVPSRFQRGCQPAIRPQIPLEMLIPIIRPTIVSGTGFNEVGNTDTTDMLYRRRETFRTTRPCRRLKKERERERERKLAGRSPTSQGCPPSLAFVQVRRSRGLAF